VSWPVEKLGSVIEYIRGVTFKPEDLIEPFTENSIVVMRTKNVQILALTTDDLIAIPKSNMKRKEQKLQVGDLLISSANSWELVGKASYVNELGYEATAGGFISIIRPNKNKIDPRYLYHWIMAPKNQHLIRHCGRQTTNISNLDTGRFKELEIPLPTIAEQKRIAAILDKVDVIRRKRQQTIKLAYNFLRSVFLDTFGDPVVNPKGWEVKKLEEVVLKVTDGVHAKPNYTDTGTPFISVKNITTGVLSFNNTKFISEDDHKKYSKRCNVEYRDILYTKVGATYGRPAIVEVDKEFSLYVSVALIKPDHSKIDAYFLKEVLGSSALKRQADRAVKGAGVPDLHLIEIKKFLIPLPDMQIQKLYVSKTRRIYQKISKYNSSLQDLNSLFNSLSQRAFRGEL
jgi:type I restriction enzyme S subunit